LNQALDEIERAIWRELHQCVNRREHAWRTPVLATVDGDAADARVVVLREVGDGELVFFTDARSPKVAQARARPDATLVFWSPALRWQLRIRAVLGVETEGSALTERWNRLSKASGAGDYLAAVPPGTPLEAAAAAGSEPHFAIVRAAVRSIDWLELDPGGAHRRAAFATGHLSRWLQP